MRILVAIIPLLCSACFYGSEFIDAEGLKEAAAACGLTEYRINHEDGAYYLDLPAGSTNAQEVQRCIEEKAGNGMMALVRVDESDVRE